jgi:predicted MFS family arabinose efflux permease
MRIPINLTPLRYSRFRWLWVGLSASYAGDRLQELAQAWLVAGLAQSSALAVGWIASFASIPQLFMPLGGVIADQVDRRKLLIMGQVAGACFAAVVGGLVLIGHVLPWHIYAWAFISGIIWLFSRPAYKVILTEVVPRDEVRSAVALNSTTESITTTTVNLAGSVLLAWIGLPVAFLLNMASYLVAAGSLWRISGLTQPIIGKRDQFSLRRVSSDLKDGFSYLIHQPTLFRPLLLTFLTVMCTVPVVGLLAAIIHKQGGSIIDLGLLFASAGFGAIAGAIYAGAHPEGDRPVHTYAWLGIAAAMAAIVFIFTPISFFTSLPLAVIGFVFFSETVWNTSRVRMSADPTFQGRLQSLTTMAFTLGGALGQLWGGFMVDRFGIQGLAAGAILLCVISTCALIPQRQRYIRMQG